MIFKELSVPGAFEIVFDPKLDDRGFFVRTYDEETFKAYGLPTNWVQESRAFTKTKGTIRGLHFLYPPSNESKFISMVGGEGFWVFIDIRKGSPTLGKWGTITLSAEKQSGLFLPKGFANGLCTLTDNCHVIYHMDTPYDDNMKSEFKWDDPDLSIPWPANNPELLAPRDKNAQSFKEFLEKSGGGLTI